MCWNRAYRKAFRMNDWESVKELQALCGRMDLIRMYDERKLFFWYSVNGFEKVVLQACYVSLSRTNEFTLLTYIIMMSLLFNLLQMTRRTILLIVFTARCYASAVLAMGLCPSVSVSVTSRCSTKTAKRRITQTTPHDTPGTLFF